LTSCPGSPTLLFACPFVSARTPARPRGQLRSPGKAAQVGADRRQPKRGTAAIAARHGLEPGKQLFPGAHAGFHCPAQVGERGVHIITMPEVCCQPAAVLGPHTPCPGVFQPAARSLAPSVGSIRAHSRVRCSFQARAHHGPGGEARNGGGKPGAFELGSLQDLLHAMDHPRPRLSSGLALPGHIPASAVRRRRNTPTPPPAVVQPGRHPCRLLEVGFAPRQRLQRLGVDHESLAPSCHHLEPRLPRHARRFQRHGRAAPRGQPGGSGAELGAQRAEAPPRLPETCRGLEQGAGNHAALMPIPPPAAFRGGSQQRPPVPRGGCRRVTDVPALDRDGAACYPEGCDS
jgi:hypothetical protein